MHAVAGHHDAPLVVREPEESCVGEACDPDVPGSGENVVTEGAKRFADPRRGEVGVEDQPHLAASSA